MTSAAPRIDSRLRAAIERLDDPNLPVAETNRRVGEIAEIIGLARPSYQQVRLLVRAHRARRLVPGIGSVLLDISFRAAPPEALVDFLAKTGPVHRRTK